MNLFKTNFFLELLARVDQWSRKKFLAISIFNFVVIVLFLLRSAGYFEPYFLISVNFIVVIGLLLSILLLGSKSKEMFIVSLLFWLFAGLLRVLNIETWAERTAIYMFEALLIGVILLIKESFKKSTPR